VSIWSDPPYNGAVNKSLSRRLFTASVFCTALSAGAVTRNCDVCGRRLRRRAWTYDGKTCCSEECVDELRPQCAVCRNTIRGDYRESEGKIFCGADCFRTTLPRCKICKKPIEQGFTITRHHYCDSCVEKQPTCFSCGLPSVYPTQLDDGRDICGNCMRRAVYTEQMAQRHYEMTLRHLEAWTSLRLETLPELVLVDKNEMKELSKNLRKTSSPVLARGLYSRQIMMEKQGLLGSWKEVPEETQETIYIIDHLNDEVFRVAAIHELMHDIIHEHFPRLKDAPMWVHEGICQLAAANYCRRLNYADTLIGIEKCSDPDYGDGYQYIKSITGRQGWYALRRWMETVDVAALPETAPK